MFYTYIIYSFSKDKYYIGYTSDIKKRLIRHNAGGSRYTKSGIPWVLVYSEEFSKKSDSIKREKEIKRKKSRKYIEYLIKNEEQKVVPI